MSIKPFNKIQVCQNEEKPFSYNISPKPCSSENLALRVLSVSYSFQWQNNTNIYLIKSLPKLVCWDIQMVYTCMTVYDYNKGPNQDGVQIEIKIHWSENMELQWIFIFLKMKLI